ncbi:amidase [Lichenifustis flavocetrariae]|uniref:Amidase family protein n=1 Tax=Lichenifustis flavocetrariae TaxID=2949735 RepID=A0AA42CKP2_9HYPH|nr:amidase family protein [Lichenifustis flavocetrariae]MCW6510773.1 amidase family protein [Lichenifustis flavocetrariae]
MTLVTEEGGVAVNDLARLSAGELLRGYRAGHFTPVDVVDDVIASLKRVDSRCNVVVEPLYEQARRHAEAAALDWAAGRPHGPLAGVPVTIKDLVFVAGVPARGGAPANQGFVPKADAAVVSRLRAAGAVVTCKTTTCESGYKLTADSPVSGITRNPWRLDRTSGGSSGGAVAAMAAGCGPLAVGTDGVGSIRVPSSFCGVFGIKPTFGLVPRSPGFSPPSWGSLAHTGPITRTVADAALMLGIMAGHDARDGSSLPLSGFTYEANPGSLAGLRVAASVDLGYAAVDPEIRAAFDRALDTLANCGAAVIVDGLEVDPGILDRTLKPIALTEQAAAVSGRSAADLADSEPDYLAAIDQGRRYSGTDYIEATYRRGDLRAKFLALFDRADILVTPTVAVTAFAAGTLGVDAIDGRPVDPHLGWSPFSWPMNLAGLPAATVPCGFDRDGLPIGLQIVAPWLGEAAIFRVAAAFEAAQPWAGRWPDIA